MQYTEIIQLINVVESKDNIGNIIQTETQTQTYAQKNAVGSKEFYNATAVGITPTAELQIRLSNYSGQKEVSYNGERYSVIRTIPKGKSDIVLVIGIKEGVS